MATSCHGSKANFANLTAALIMCIIAAVVAFPTSINRHGFDKLNSGQNRDEKVLNPSVNFATNFGKLAQQFNLQDPTETIYAQPLWLVTSINGNTRRLVIIASEANIVYAFDSDKSTGNLVWKTSLDPAGPVPASVIDCSDIAGSYGITATPVLSDDLNTLYVLANVNKADGKGHQTSYIMYALNTKTGKVTGNSGSIQFSAKSTSGKAIQFNPDWQLARAGLTFDSSSGTSLVFASWGSHCDNNRVDPAGNANNMYHGWVASWQVTAPKAGTISFSFKNVFITSPQDPAPPLNNDGGGDADGVWMSGSAMPIYKNVLYLATGNGATKPSTGNFGDSIVSLSATTLRPTSSFTPSDYLNLDANDEDQGSGGVLVLPETDVNGGVHVMQGGKSNYLYYLATPNLGGFNSRNDDANAAQRFDNGAGTYGALAWLTSTSLPGCGGSGVHKAVYTVPAESFPRRFDYCESTGKFLETPSEAADTQFPWPGATPTLTSNAGGGAIMWALNLNYGDPTSQVVLHAFNAVSMASLYSSDANSADLCGSPVKFSRPLVVNGKVFVQSIGKVCVYGLLPSPRPATAAAAKIAAAIATAKPAPANQTGLVGSNNHGPFSPAP